jgi:methyltransferase (TIGR00027 family)
LDAGKTSRTAESVAKHRAAHQIFGFPLVLDDPLALPIIGSDAVSDLRANCAREMETRVRHLRAFLVARSRFSEDAARAAFARGTSQYVLLGAGLDTSALRFATAFPNVRAVEIDHPATQSWKRERLAVSGIAMPESLRFAAVDFENETLA